jgi:hypothetical protein
MNEGGHGLIAVAHTVVNRYRARRTRGMAGPPLFTGALTDPEFGALRTGLRAAVAVHGIAGLRGDICRSAFVFYASTFFAGQAVELSWRPLLADLGVVGDELGEYHQLYNSVQRALEDLGRDVVVRRGRRFFLATFLREGGLPLHIGEIARLVTTQVRSVGWAAVLDENVRDWMVDAVAASAGGAAATLLASEESRFALGELLGDVARTHRELVSRSVDPTTFANAEEVEAALAKHAIPVPAMRSRPLLIELLGSFRDASHAPRTAVLVPSATFVAREHDGLLSFRIAMDLALLASIEGLPDTVALASVPGPTRPVLAQKVKDAWVDSARSEPRIELPLPSLPSRVVLSARWSRQGTPATATVGTVTAPLDDVLWFGTDGELLSGTLESISVGSSVVCVGRTHLELATEGNVEVRELTAPEGFPSAYAVMAQGPGEFRVTSFPDADEDAPRVHHVACGRPGFRVEVQPGPPPPWGSSAQVVARLPALVLPEGIEAEITVTSGQEPFSVRGLRGRIMPSSFDRIARMSGRVRVVFQTASGERWSRTWFVLPRTFGIETKQRTVFVRHDATLRVSSPWKYRAVDSGTACEGTGAQLDDDVCELLVRLGDETARLVVPVPRGLLRLRRTPSAASEPLDGDVTVKEREVLEGACIELAGTEATRLEISVGNRNVLEASQPSSRRLVVPVMEVLARTAHRQSPLRVFLRVRDGATTREASLRIVVPRFAKPQRLTEGGEPGRLTLRVDLDGTDMPARPALAVFAVTEPFGEPTLVPASMSTPAAGRALVSVSDEDGTLATSHRIVFLVDEAVSPPRPMSGGTLLAAPKNTPPPAGATPLASALWGGDERKIEEALEAAAREVGSCFLDDLIAASSQRAAYGQSWFYPFVRVADGLAWVLLAAAARLPRAARLPWLQTWQEQHAGLRWTFVTTSQAQALASTLPASMRHDSEDKMHLLQVAKDAAGMPRAAEIVLSEALFRGASLPPVRHMLREGAPDGKHLPQDFAPHLSLPTAPLVTRWLRGGDIDGDDWTLVQKHLEERLLGGARVRALRELWLTRPLPRLPRPPRLSAAWLAPLEARLQADWAPLADPAARDLEIATVDFAAAVHLHQRQLHHLSQGDRENVREVEHLVPRLFEFWLTALKLFPPKDPK